METATDILRYAKRGNGAKMFKNHDSNIYNNKTNLWYWATILTNKYNFLYLFSGFCKHGQLFQRKYWCLSRIFFCCPLWFYGIPWELKSCFLWYKVRTKKLLIRFRAMTGWIYIQFRHHSRSNSNGIHKAIFVLSNIMVRKNYIKLSK